MFQILPNDPKARRIFVTSGGLKKVQEIEAQPGTTLYEYINVINSCFPDEIVRYYSPGYPETLLERVEQYSPQMRTLLRESHMEDTEIQTDIAPFVDVSSDDDIGKNEPPVA